MQIGGKFVSATDSRAHCLGQFYRPYGLAVSPDESLLLVADYCNHHVVVADARDGRSLHTLRVPAYPLPREYPVAVALVPRTGPIPMTSRAQLFYRPSSA